MMKKLLLLVLTICTLASCDKEKEPFHSITIPNQQQLSQTVYADDTAGKSGVTFTTTGAWTSEISASTPSKATPAAADWVTISPSSGEKAGEYTMQLSLLTNYTGEKRAATIAIKCNDDLVRIVVTQEATTATGEKPTPDPEPTGEGVVRNETTGVNATLTGMEHTIKSPQRVRINFSAQIDGKTEQLSIDFYNPQVNGKLKAGTYTVKLVNTYPAPTPIDGDCEWYKSSLSNYGTSGTVTVAVTDHTFTFTFNLFAQGLNFGTDKLTGSFTGIPTYTNKEVRVASITLNETSKTLEKGESIALTATILPENATDKRYSWSSSNPAVATVSDEGLVQSVAAGTTTITATTTEGAKTATCTVKVNPPVAVTGIKVEPAEVSLLEGENYEFFAENKVTVLPANATNKQYTFTSSDDKVAVYDGKTIVAKVAGIANISFTTKDGNKTATLKVTVTKRPSSGAGQYVIHDPNGKYPDETYTLIEAAHTVVTKNSVDLFFKSTTGAEVLKLRFNNTLSNGRLAAGTYTCTRVQNGANGTVYHTENYNNIGYFSGGTITIAAVGDTYTFSSNAITTTNGMTASLAYTGTLTYRNQYVEVTSVSLNSTSLALTLGSGAQLEATVNPTNAFSKNVTWSTSNANIATVSSSGYVSTNGIGTTTITVTTEDGNKTATCQVTVAAQPATGSGTFANNQSQSLTINRAEQQVNMKNPREITLSFAKPSSVYSDLSFMLIRATNDTGALKAGTYATIENLMCDALGVKYSGNNTGTATVTQSGDNYTVTLNVTTAEGVQLSGSYTGKLPTPQ